MARVRRFSEWVKRPSPPVAAWSKPGPAAVAEAMPTEYAARARLAEEIDREAGRHERVDDAASDLIARTLRDLAAKIRSGDAAVSRRWVVKRAIAEAGRAKTRF